MDPKIVALIASGKKKTLDESGVLPFKLDSLNKKPLGESIIAHKRGEISIQVLQQEIAHIRGQYIDFGKNLSPMETGKVYFFGRDDLDVLYYVRVLEDKWELRHSGKTDNLAIKNPHFMLYIPSEGSLTISRFGNPEVVLLLEGGKKVVV